MHGIIVSTSRFKRLACSVALSVIAVLGFASNAPATAATLNLNPTHEVASAAGNYFDATFYVDTCLMGVTARIFWQGPAPIASVVDPPCSGQTMTVFFSHVPGPGPTPGYTTVTAGLWADSDTTNLRAYVTAQAVFRIDAPPPPPSVKPGPLPTGRVGPPAGPPATVAPSQPPPPVSPTATPCPVLTAAIIHASTNPTELARPPRLMQLVAVLLMTVLLLVTVRRRRAAAVVVFILFAIVTLSCGRYPLNASSEAPSPTASQLAPTPSPTC